MNNDGLDKPSGVALLRCLLGHTHPPTSVDDEEAASTPLALADTVAKAHNAPPPAPDGGWHVDVLDCPDGLPRTYPRRALF
jgi:hypothetical protein